MAEGTIKRCLRCSAEFGCGAKSQTGTCWCADLPPVMEVTDAGCLCPPCLREEVARVQAREREAAGLCAECRHVKRLRSKGGGLIYLCGRAAEEPGFPKYPRLPVSACGGHERA